MAWHGTAGGARIVRAWLGVVWLGRQGEAWHGRERQGKAWQAI